MYPEEDVEKHLDHPAPELELISMPKFFGLVETLDRGARLV